jgi:futalosine hydrolase
MIPFKVLLVTATSAEADAVRKIAVSSYSGDGFSLGNSLINLLITGVGSIATSWAMTKWLSSNSKPDLALNIGIAGSYKDDIKIGEVVVPVSDCFADAGVETGNGFITLTEAGLEDPCRFPFREGRIIAESEFVRMAVRKIKPVTAVTVNTASGSEATIARIIKKFNPDIETMEGATFFYICSMAEIPFLAIRSVSNRVEARNKDNWNIPLALDNLSEKFREFFVNEQLR